MKEDVLDMTYINSLPQPIIGIEFGGSEWSVIDIDVSTGLLRIDVCGLFQVMEISDFKKFRDGNGVERLSDAFYSDATEEDRAPTKENQQ
jgi:hypothetical protein